MILTNFAVTGMLCSFKVVIDIKVLSKLFSKQFYFVRYTEQHLAISVDMECIFMEKNVGTKLVERDTVSYHRQNHVKQMFFSFSNSTPVMQIYFAVIFCSEKFLRESKFEKFLTRTKKIILKSAQYIWL